MNQEMDWNGKMFWKEVDKGKVGKVENCSIIKAKKVRLAGSEE